MFMFMFGDDNKQPELIVASTTGKIENLQNL